MTFVAKQVLFSNVEDSAPEHNWAIERAACLADQFQTTAAETDDERAFPVAEFQEIAASGLLKLPLSPELGGLGLDGGRETGATQLQVLKEIGRGNLSIGRVFEGHVNALMLMQAFGTSDQRRRWAADVRDRNMVSAVWNTEAGDGVTFEPLPGGRFRLEGFKTFCSGAGYVQRPIVTGRLPDGGWQMSVVPLERVRVEIDTSWWRPMGMRASASYRVDFTGVILEPDDLLGQPGDYHRQPWFSAGAIRFAAVQLGGAEALLDATRVFLQRLRRTEDPYQRQRIGEAAIAIESGDQWLRRAGECIDLGPDAGLGGDDVIARAINYANMTRLAIEAICTQIMQVTVQSAGARAMLRPDPIERIVRDLTFYLRQPAPDAALAGVGEFALEKEARAGRLWHQDV